MKMLEKMSQDEIEELGFQEEVSRVPKLEQKQEQTSVPTETLYWIGKIKKLEQRINFLERNQPNVPRIPRSDHPEVIKHVHGLINFCVPELDEQTIKMLRISIGEKH